MLPQNNLSYPVLISTGDGSKGSGFYLTTETGTYLISACHVLFKQKIELIKSITLTSLASDFSSKVVFELDCLELFAWGSLQKHQRADVAVCKIGTSGAANDMGNRVMTPGAGVTLKVPPPAGTQLLGMPISLIRKFADVTISNDVFLFGYPTSLGHEAQLSPATPLLRKGIIAGKTEDGRVVIDCPVYFGNSGGLVVEVFAGQAGATNFHGIGIAVEMVPFVEVLWSKQFNAKTGIRFENSGYSIVEPIDRILELIQ